MLHNPQWTSFCGVVELMAGSYQSDESAGLRAAVCRAAGQPDEQQHAEEALQRLRRNNPDLLRQLLQQHGNFSVQVCWKACCHCLFPLHCTAVGTSYGVS